MKKNRWATSLAAAALAMGVLGPMAHAQDLGGIFRGLLNHRAADLMNMVIKSVTEVSMGQIAQGAQAPQDAEGKVVLYSTSWCGYCKRAIAHMQQRNIPFVERNIESNPAYKAEYRSLGGKGGVPYIVFGTRTVSGFSESSFDSHYAEYQRSQATAAPAQDDERRAVPVAAGAAAPGTGGLQSGDSLVGKIAGIPVLTQPSKKAARLAALGKTEEVIYMGEEREGFYRVTSAQGEGWVDKLLVRKN